MKLPRPSSQVSVLEKQTDHESHSLYLEMFMLTMTMTNMMMVATQVFRHNCCGSPFGCLWIVGLL